MKFEIITELKKEKLLRLNREEFKIIKGAFLIISGIEILLSGFLIIYDVLKEQINFQDFRNFILGIILIIIFWFFPEICTYLQIPILKRSHLDGERYIIISEEGIEIQSRKYNISKKHKLSEVDKIYDKKTYFKMIINKRPLFIHKEDFIIGKPEEFYDSYCRKVFNNK